MRTHAIGIHVLAVVAAGPMVLAPAAAGAQTTPPMKVFLEAMTAPELREALKLP